MSLQLSRELGLSFLLFSVVFTLSTLQAYLSLSLGGQPRNDSALKMLHFCKKLEWRHFLDEETRMKK